MGCEGAGPRQTCRHLPPWSLFPGSHPPRSWSQKLFLISSSQGPSLVSAAQVLIEVPSPTQEVLEVLGVQRSTQGCRL